MRRWLSLWCFGVVQRDLDRWYKTHASELSHADWKEIYQAVKYLKKHVKYRLGRKKKRALKPSSSTPNQSVEQLYRISNTAKINKAPEE